MTIRPRFISLILLLGMLAAGCSEAPVAPAETSEAASLPLLASGRVLSLSAYGSADLPAEGTPERALFDDAVTGGLRGFTFYVDWPDLEPEPGVYTLDDFTEALDAVQALGLTPFVNLTVGDIEDYNLPDDLSDGSGGLGDGVSLDDPAIIERFGRVLDRVVPILAARGGFYLGVGNEIDSRFDGEFPEERAPYVRFVEAARERVHDIEPRLAVGVTLTAGAIRAQSQTFRDLRAVTDIIPFNYGPIQLDVPLEDFFTVFALDDILDDFREVAAAYGSGPIAIQELTCPSPESMGASDAWQRGCFERLFAEIGRTPQVRFASIFTFQDFGGATCDLFNEAIWGDELDDLPPALAQRLRDYVCFLGVVAPDGTPKPAWNVVRTAASQS
ncbi:MAG: hypothetical protein AAGI91_08505 [Bacteroidota bacterium]